MSTSHVPSVRGYLLVFAALMALTSLTVWAAFQHFGALWNDIIAMAIAATKALLVMLFFMHLRHATRVVKIAMLSSLGFFLLLIAFLLADVLTRGVFEAPLQPWQGI